jgi:hypothetical protein
MTLGVSAAVTDNAVVYALVIDAAVLMQALSTYSACQYFHCVNLRRAK